MVAEVQVQSDVSRREIDTPGNGDVVRQDVAKVGPPEPIFTIVWLKGRMGTHLVNVGELVDVVAVMSSLSEDQCAIVLSQVPWDDRVGLQYDATLR